MRIGIVSQWRNQGQATLSRHLRDVLDSLGHETFVLARPTRDEHVLPGKIDHEDVWAQRNVEDASHFEIPLDEYVGFAKRHAIEVCFFNQNYQWKELRKLREIGVKNVGYFVWESFEREHVAKAKAAYDVVYSLNRATQARYARFGMRSPLLFWGLHPELLAVPRSRPRGQPDTVSFFFPGGLLGPRKPIRSIVEAFRNAKGDHLRLVLKAQIESPLAEPYETKGDPRIVELIEDVDCAAYYRLFASCDVCIGVSRWEGTGLHFFEAIAFGMPLVVNDVPPMNELVDDGTSGRLVASHVVGATKTGVPSYDPDVPHLTRILEELSDATLRERLAEGQRKRREAMPWQRTIDELSTLLKNLA